MFTYLRGKDNNYSIKNRTSAVKIGKKLHEYAISKNFRNFVQF